MIKSPIKWYGGKHYLAEWIIELMPPHSIYAEAFGGGASVLCRKEPAQLEAYNDINANLVQFFQVLRDHREQFIEYVSLIPYSQSDFNDAGESTDCNSLTTIQSAARNFTRWRQSFAGQGKSWASSTTRSRGGIADCVNAWRRAIEGLYEVSERLLNTQIHCETFSKFIPRFDWTGAVIYCDPPYFPDTRVSKAVYQYEMTEAEHSNFLHVANSCRLATVMISGYDNAMYDAALSSGQGWQKHTREISNHAAGGASKRRMFECLWIRKGNGVL